MKFHDGICDSHSHKLNAYQFIFRVASFTCEGLARHSLVTSQARSQLALEEGFNSTLHQFVLPWVTKSPNCFSPGAHASIHVAPSSMPTWSCFTVEAQQ